MKNEHVNLYVGTIYCSLMCDGCGFGLLFFRSRCATRSSMVSAPGKATYHTSQLACA